jgi:hypothetical protein
MPFDTLKPLLEPQALWGAALLIFLAGLSEGLGSQGVVLLVNRISPLGFAAGLAASALLFLLSAAVWVAGLWLSFEAFFGVVVPLGAFFVTVSAAYAPLLLGALSLLPVIGPLIGWLLRVWSFGVALAAIAAVTGLGLWQAAAGALLGSLLVEGARWLLSEPARDFGRGLLTAVTGRSRLLARRDLPEVIPGYEPAEVER